MTQPDVHNIPIDQIWVDRENRQRFKLDEKHIDSLAASIDETGLINFPVVTREFELKAGEHRLHACLQLGWKEIPVHFTDELDPLKLHLIEQEENLRRKNLEWQEEVAALKAYHELRAAADPSWNIEKTAEALHVSPTSLSDKISVATELESGNVRVAAAEKYSKANTITKRDKSRREAATLASLSTGTPDQADEDRVPIRQVDFTEWAQSYDGPKFNFIHCDFPYGVDADKHHQGASDVHGGYEDSKETYFQLLGVLCNSGTSFISEKAHLIFWFSMDYYDTTFNALTGSGWRVNPFPLVWFKNDNTGIIPDAMRGPRRVYETAFMASRGDHLIVEPVGNCCPAPGKSSDKIHMSQKSEEMLRHFFRMTVDEHTTMLDPTCGSGIAVKVAESMGAKSVLGLERDEEFYKRAKENYNA